MSNLPRFLLRNCNLMADRQNKLGQIGDITIPELKKKTEEMRNSGMVKPREVDMGYEVIPFSFEMPGFDPQILALAGLRPGQDSPFLITGSLVDEDGTRHSAVITVRAMVKGHGGASWKPGEVGSNKYDCSVNYYKLEIDAEEICEVDDFDIKIRGVSQYAGQRADMLLD